MQVGVVPGVSHEVGHRHRPAGDPTVRAVQLALPGQPEVPGRLVVTVVRLVVGQQVRLDALPLRLVLDLGEVELGGAQAETGLLALGPVLQSPRASDVLAPVAAEVLPVRGHHGDCEEDGEGGGGHGSDLLH